MLIQVKLTTKYLVCKAMTFEAISGVISTITNSMTHWFSVDNDCVIEFVIVATEDYTCNSLQGNCLANKTFSTFYLYEYWVDLNVMLLCGRHD